MLLLRALVTRQAQKVVKKWGPIQQQIIGQWHHVCFTLRFGRVYSPSDYDPDAVIAQAFMFVDGDTVQEFGADFAGTNIKNDLRLTTGVTSLYVGGSNPSIDATGYQNFKGNIDKIRLWWPSCPHRSDPTRCNPYGFIHPKLRDGSTSPTAKDPTTNATLQVSHDSTALKPLTTCLRLCRRRTFASGTWLSRSMPVCS